MRKTNGESGRIAFQAAASVNHASSGADSMDGEGTEQGMHGIFGNRECLEEDTDVRWDGARVSEDQDVDKMGQVSRGGCIENRGETGAWVCGRDSGDRWRTPTLKVGWE